MGKLVRRFLFGDLFNMGEYEEYFTEMSRQGLHLGKLGSYFAYFREGGPRHLNYRIDLTNNDNKEKQIKKHKEKGWDFVCEKDNYLIFSSPINSGLKELYNTPLEQKLTFEKAEKEIIGNTPLGLWLTFISTLIIVLLSYQMIKMEGGLILSLIRGNIIFPIVFGVFSYIIQLGKYLNFKRLEKTLDSGEFLNHSKDYSLMRRQFIVKKSITFAIILLIISPLLYKVLVEESINLSAIEDISTLPVISIKNIEDKDYKRTDAKDHIVFKNDGINYGNYIRKSWSLVAPEEYALIESGTFKSNKLKELAPRLIVDYYLGRFEGIAKTLEKEIITREKGYKWDLEKIYEEGEHTFYGVKGDGHKALLCRKGKEVMYIKYFGGTATMEDIMEAVIKKLEL